MRAISYIEPHWLASGKQATIEHYTREAAAALLPAFADRPHKKFVTTQVLFEQLPIFSHLELGEDAEVLKRGGVTLDDDHIGTHLQEELVQACNGAGKNA